MRNIAAKYEILVSMKRTCHVAYDNIYYIFMCGLLAAKYYAIDVIQRMPLFFPNGNIIFR